MEAPCFVPFQTRIILILWIPIPPTWPSSCKLSRITHHPLRKFWNHSTIVPKQQFQVQPSITAPVGNSGHLPRTTVTFTGRKHCHKQRNGCLFDAQAKQTIACIHSFFCRQGSADSAQRATLNNCFGAVIGYDLGVSGLLGIAFTGTAADLQSGCKQMFPVASFPPFSLQLGFIDCSNPTFVMELTAGLDAGAGLPGFTSCTTTAL